jgi:ribonuclease HI
VDNSLITVYCDGSIRGGNPGGYGYSGWIALDSEGNKLYEGSECLGSNAQMSNNVAEYKAVFLALQYLVKAHQMNKLLVHSDSQLVINQLTGVWNCSESHLQILRNEVLLLSKKFPGVVFSWVPREQNKRADFLSKRLQHRRKPNNVNK